MFKNESQTISISRPFQTYELKETWKKMSLYQFYESNVETLFSFAIIIPWSQDQFLTMIKISALRGNI